MHSSKLHDPYQALRVPNFRLFLTANVTSSLAGRMMSVGIGWELYERTNSALALGMVGLVQLLPVIFLSILTGHVADHYSRKRIVILSKLVLVMAALGLAMLSYSNGSLVATYGCLLLMGIGGAFLGPASGALTAEVLPDAAFENAASWSTSTMTIASVVGPAIGGVLIASFKAATIVFAINAAASLISIALLLLIKGGHGEGHRIMHRRERPSLRSLSEGWVFLRWNPTVFSAITLDLFAVLFGGATTLLPIFAKDILFVGPAGLGWLQAASSMGAAGVALYLTHQPPLRRAGPTLLAVVAGFGAATIIFGISTWFWLSFLMLVTLGGLDSVSMVIRDTLILTRTPDEMRGRVAAIEGLFVSSSNQLGGFESGVTAHLFGPVLSVIGGGLGTIIVVIVIATAWPDLRRLTTIRESKSD